MTLRAADLRFVVPGAVRSAVLLGGDDAHHDDHGGWWAALSAGLAAGGVDVLDVEALGGAARVDLVVATGGRARQAETLACAARIVLDAGPLRAGDGWARSPLLLRGHFSRPLAVVPADQPDAVGRYLTELSSPPSRRARGRNRVLGAALRAPGGGQLLAARTGTALWTPPAVDRLPRLLQQAVALGVPQSASWVLMLGAGDDLQRAVFHLRAPDRRAWVVKFSRVAGHDGPFVRDEDALALVRRAGPGVSAHAPSHLGRFEVDGLPASVETAVPGQPLAQRLQRGGAVEGHVALLEAIATWVVRMGRDTVAPVDALEAERRRLELDVLPHWRSAGAPADLVSRVGEVPGVLQHNDLGTWNLVTDGTAFGAVDWESARAVGLPLWDLLYLLADGLARLDGAVDPEVLTGRALRLLRGEDPRSDVLFAHVLVAAQALNLPLEAVGPIATLCWLHHGLSARGRATELGSAPPAETGHLARLAAPWLADAALGPAWPAFTRWARGAS